MRILTYRPDCDRKAIKAFSTLVQTGADFLLGIWRYPIDALLARIATVWTNRAVRPAQLLEIFPRSLLGREPLRELNEGKVALLVLAAWSGIVLVCHARIMKIRGIVKCIIAVHWVEPKLVAEIAYLVATAEGGSVFAPSLSP